MIQTQRHRFNFETHANCVSSRLLVALSLVYKAIEFIICILNTNKMWKIKRLPTILNSSSLNFFKDSQFLPYRKKVSLNEIDNEFSLQLCINLQLFHIFALFWCLISNLHQKNSNVVAKISVNCQLESKSHQWFVIFCWFLSANLI